VVAILAVLAGATDLLTRVDHSVARWAYEHPPFSHRVLTLVTDLGEAWTVLVVAVAIAMLDFVRRRSYWALPFMLVVILGAKLWTQLLKHLVDRARPPYEPVAATLGPSFPSGHSSTAAAAWAAFAFVAALWWGRRARLPLGGLAVAIAVAVATSRVLLDVHWLTDVIGGLALGWAWFAIGTIAFARLLRSGAPALSDPGSSRRGR
jgi:undecaprenyl-diphosphatase